MKHTCLFLLIIPIVITVLMSSATNSGYSSTLENNTALQAAQKSLDANQEQLATVSSDPPPAAVQWIHGDSMVPGVFFTWVIITSGNEAGVNLRYVGDGTTPSISVAATALSSVGKQVTMKGSVDLNAGWISPLSLEIPVNGESSLYDAISINVVASPLGSSPPSPTPTPSLSSTPSTASQSNANDVTTSPPVEPQTQGGGLKVLSSNSLIDRIGFFHVVGEIQNGTPDPVTFVQASATFYDKNNRVVGTSFGYTNPPDLGPGDKAPFEIILTSSSVPANLYDPT